MFENVVVHEPCMLYMTDLALAFPDNIIGNNYENKQRHWFSQ